MSWYHPSDPKNIKAIPWLSPEVIAFLESIIKPEWRVLEHGGGGSTLWYAQRCQEVVTSETDENWRRAILNKADELNLRNITLYTQWPQFSTRLGKFDLIVIDGAPLHQKGEALADAFKYYAKAGAWVALDNFNRPEYAEELLELRRGKEERLFFAKNGRYLNTAFWHV